MNEVEMQAPRVILKLNTSVLNALFPEASEARVQLQQAVLAELTRATIKGAIEQQFFNALENAAEARVQLYIDQLESKVEYAVKQRIDRLTSDAINARVTAAVDAARATL